MRLFRQAQSSKISIPLLGKQVPFDATIEVYIAIRKVFEELGEEVCADFTESFYSEYRDMDDLMKRIDNMGYAISAASAKSKLFEGGLVASTPQITHYGQIRSTRI